MTVGMPPLLEVQGITLHFGGLAALDDASFSVAEGETLGIIGPNGAGKTTLLNCLSGVYRYRSGDALLRGSSLRRVSAYRIAALGVARTFQGADNFGEFTVLQFVLLSRLRFQRKGFVSSALGLPDVRRSERAEASRAMTMLERFQLADLADHHLHNLSYGTRKILDIVRVLLSEPQVLLLDEPTSGTTMEDRATLLEILHDVRSTGLTSIVVDHDVAFVTALCDKLLVMNSGTVLAYGDPAELLGRPDVIRAYIGSDDEP